jgi:hypothetical protein
MLLLDWGTQLLSMLLLSLLLLSLLLLSLLLLSLLLLSLLLLSLGVQQLARRMLLWGMNPLLLDWDSLLLSMCMIEELSLLTLLEAGWGVLMSTVLLDITIVGRAWIVITIHAVSTTRLLQIRGRNTRCRIANLGGRWREAVSCVVRLRIAVEMCWPWDMMAILERSVMLEAGALGKGLILIKPVEGL